MNEWVDYDDETVILDLVTPEGTATWNVKVTSNEVQCLNKNNGRFLTKAEAAVAFHAAIAAIKAKYSTFEYVGDMNEDMSYLPD